MIENPYVGIAERQAWEGGKEAGLSEVRLLQERIENLEDWAERFVGGFPLPPEEEEELLPLKPPELFFGRPRRRYQNPAAAFWLSLFIFALVGGTIWVLLQG